MRIITFLILLLATNLYAATCTTTSRTNYSTGQVLTSTALNADFNQLVTKANAMDGGCITDSSLESTAFDSSLDALKNGIHQGCLVSYSDANTVSVSKCILSVGGKFVKTTAATTATWGGSNPAESPSTQYYLYAKTTSTATTLDLLISTTAPGADGLDAVTGNKVLGKFYNTAGSAIDSALVYSWVVSNFTQSPTGSNLESFSFFYGDSPTTTCATTGPGTCGYLDQTSSQVSSVTMCQGASCLDGLYTINLARSWTKIYCTGAVSGASQISAVRPMYATASSSVLLSTYSTVDGTTSLDSYGSISCEGY